MNRFYKLVLTALIPFSIKAQAPTATIVVPTASLCSGVNYSFTTLTANTPTAFSWTILPNFSVTATPDKSSSFINLNFGRAGVYTLSLQVTNATGSTVATRNVTVAQTAIASFNASLTTTGFPNQLVLTNYSSNQVNNQWNYSDAATEFSLNTTKSYSVGGNYTVSLIAIGANSCNDTSDYSFVIADMSDIKLPNVFTPNKDSVNDIFKPIAKGITKMKAYIYNRYGTLIYSWDKVQGYWDGYTSSGEPCASDVYFCVLEATGFDGKSYKLNTKVTLLR